MFKKIRIWLVDFVAKHLLRAVRAKDVFTTKDGSLYYRGREIEPQRRMDFAEEALSFKDSAIWKLVKSKFRWEVYQQMFHQGKSEEDIMAGKMALYTFEQIEKIFNELSRLKG